MDIQDGIHQLLKNIPPETVGNFLNQFTGTVKPKPKPQWYNKVPPCWKDQLILGLETQNDIRRFTQIRCWIKPPNQQFPKANCFLSLVNSNESVFVRLNSIDELKALRASLDMWIPQMEQKLEELKPLESQYEIANAAFNAALSAGNGDTPNYQDADFSPNEDF